MTEYDEEKILLEGLMESRRRELAQRRVQLIFLAKRFQQGLALFIVWLGVNSIVYMLTGVLYWVDWNNTGVHPPPHAALSYRPQWLLFQIIVNLVIWGVATLDEKS